MGDIPVWLRIGVGVFITVLGLAIVWGEPFVVRVDLDKIPLDVPKGGFSFGGIAVIDDSYEGDVLEYMIQHEAKHTWQYGVSAVLSFPITYVSDLSFNYFKYGNWDDAYNDMFLERQAYNYQYWYIENFLTNVELEVNF